MTQGKLMPIGSIFGTEGVAYGIRRYPGNAQHPLYNLFSLCVDTVAPPCREEGFLCAPREKRASFARLERATSSRSASTRWRRFLCVPRPGSLPLALCRP